MNGHAGSFQVLSVQVPTKLAAGSLRLRQYRLVAQTQVGPQQELTFAVGSQGTLSDAGAPSAPKQSLNSSAAATAVVKATSWTRGRNRRSIIRNRIKSKVMANVKKCEAGERVNIKVHEYHQAPNHDT